VDAAAQEEREVGLSVGAKAVTNEAETARVARKIIERTDIVELY
jgi:hypothetical protein